jgi:hypothetical protein
MKRSRQKLIGLFKNDLNSLLRKEFQPAGDGFDERPAFEEGREECLVG